MKSKSINLLLRLLNNLSKERKLSLLSLLPIAILTGISDLVVVGLVSRLFTAVVGKENRPIIPFSDLITTDPFLKIIYLIIIYVVVNWIASFCRLLLRAFQEKLRANIFLDLSEIAQKNILYQPYEFFLTEKSEDLSSKILLNISRVSEKLIRPILQIVSGFFIVLFLFIAILSFAKLSAIYLITSLIIGYSFISLVVTPIIRKASRQRIILESEISKVMIDSIRTIIDVQLTGSEGYFQSKFYKARKKAFPYLWKAETLPEFPRSLIEPFGITLIFSIGLFPLLGGKNPNNFLELIPFLATIAIASLKLTPPLQDFFRGLTDLRSGIPDVEEALNIIELKPNRKIKNVPLKNKLKLRSNIILKDICYEYPNSNQLALKNINITIPIGSRIAFVGKTGSGKTTTVNQLLCLLTPTSGSILIDGQKIINEKIPLWQSYCSYVPQSINLLNNDILTNIAYGQNASDIDTKKAFEAIEAAQLSNLIEGLPMGIKTKVGENGIRLSGGQRQRIAIARAFYRDAKLLVLDEATSALDNQTESELIKGLNKLNKELTIVFIAHRITTVKECDCIYEFENGEIKEFGNYNELLLRSNTFKEMAN